MKELFSSEIIRQDGETGQCGREVALVNLSPRQAKERGLLTSGTYGHTGSILYEHNDLSLSLANRLRAKTDLLGSTLYKLTWKERVTPLGRLIPALRASVRRISDNGCAGWPTPTTRDHKDGDCHDQLENGKIKLNSLLGREVQLTAIGQTLSGSPASTGKRGRLNPAHSRWLMGLTTAWDDCAAMVTLSSRRKQSRS